MISNKKYFFLLTDNHIQYPSLTNIHNDLNTKLIIKSNNNDLADFKSKLVNLDNYSSEEEINTQEITQISVEPPMFDRSTKVLYCYQNHQSYIKKILNIF